MYVCLCRSQSGDIQMRQRKNLKKTAHDKISFGFVFSTYHTTENPILTLEANTKGFILRNTMFYSRTLNISQQINILSCTCSHSTLTDSSHLTMMLWLVAVCLPRYVLTAVFNVIILVCPATMLHRAGWQNQFHCKSMLSCFRPSNLSTSESTVSWFVSSRRLLCAPRSHMAASACFWLLVVLVCT